MTNEEARKVLKNLKAEMDYSEYEALDMAIKALEIELLTDTEQRIFLIAMSRERKVCKTIDEEYVTDSNVSLVEVCNSIERKVKKIWE